ncbi:MAG: DUF4115 domain-containing protein [Alphaproteobacteria bacterium]|nr:MAG: DUF4115 domain-containing protein [Alphaproteobacteria bacterium]
MADPALRTEPMTPVPTYESVSVILRRARLERGRNVRSVAQVLRIRQAYLEAIEAGQFDRLPGTPYAIGFVRSYAEYLGLDGDRIVDRFKAEVQDANRQTELVFPEPVSKGRIPGGAIILISMALLAGAYGGWFYLTNQGRSVADLIPGLPSKSPVVAEGNERVTRVAPAPTPQVAARPPEPETAPEAPPSEIAVASDPAPAPIRPPLPSSRPASMPMPAAASLPPAGTAEPGTASAGGGAVQPASQARSRQPAGTAEKSAAPVAAAADVATGEEAAPVAETGAAAGSAQTAAVLPGPRATAAAAEEEHVVPAAPTSRREVSERDADTTVDMSDTAETLVAAEAVPSSAPVAATSGVAPSAPAPSVSAESLSDQARARQTASLGTVPAAVPAPVETAPLVDQTVVIPAPPTMPRNFTAPGEQAPRVYGEANRNARIVLRARQDSWVQVRDGRGDLLLTRVLRAGDVYHVPDQPGLTLLTGNAGGIEIEVDGIKLPPLGPVGAVRRQIALDPDRLLEARGAAR